LRRGIFTTRFSVLSGNEQILKPHISTSKKQLFPNENWSFLVIWKHLFSHGTEAAITMERDTSPADVNLKEEDPQARKLTQSRQRNLGS
jgi:hypothetical protein